VVYSVLAVLAYRGVAEKQPVFFGLESAALVLGELGIYGYL
jgi:hypothetical protein